MTDFDRDLCERLICEAREMLGAMAKLDAKLVNLFRGDPDQLGDRLDTVASLDATRMLSAGDGDMSYDEPDR